MTEPTPSDITAGLHARHAATEGGPLPHDALHQALVDMAKWTVDHGTANGEPEDRIVDAVRRLAVAAAQVPGFEQYATGCDGCDDRYSTDVIDAADAVLPPGSQAYDANGDPDVYICPFCVYEAANTEPEMPEPMSDAEWAELQRLNEEDEASMAAWEEGRSDG